MRRTKNRAWLWVVAIVALLAILALLFMANLRYAKKSPGGTDFLVHWVGTRSFLIDGISPYSDEVALRIQTLVYGRAAQQGEHELRVAYPLYSMVVFFPFSLIPDFTTARAAWNTLLEIALIALTFLTIRLVRWRLSPVMLAVVLLFSVFWYHALRPVILGNAVILVALAMVGVMLAVRAKMDELAGILLGLATIKPQLVVIPIIFICLWAFTKRRWKIIIWLGMTVTLLTAVAALLLPDWIVQNLREVIRYPGYNPPGNPASALADLLPAMGRRIGTGFSILVLAVMLVEWWYGRRQDFRGFLWTTCLTLTASQWSGIQTDPGNFIILYPALLLVFSLWEERWHQTGRWLVWGSMALLFFGIWALFFATVQQSYQPIQSPVMFLPLPAFLLITLYWVRWWAVRPPSLWYDLLAEEDQ